MKIWHDDLGVEDDPHELMIAPTFTDSFSWQFWGVTGGDAAVASGGEHSYKMLSLAEWFRTVHMLMLAGF